MAVDIDGNGQAGDVTRAQLNVNRQGRGSPAETCRPDTDLVDTVQHDLFHFGQFRIRVRLSQVPQEGFLG